jgi:hypothetical protein
VGPPRTATTWLDRALRGHVGLPEGTKETFFFARNYDRGLAWYADQFRYCEDATAVGEICAAYFENPSALDRIQLCLPRCKIIVTLRDPVDRLYSYYRLMRYNGKTHLPFEMAVMKHKKMLAFSRYATILGAWCNAFSPERVLAVFNDDLQADAQGYVDQIADFIGIERFPVREKLVQRTRDNTIATAPRSAALARQGRRLRSWLGANRLYRLRGMLKDVGFWRLCSEGGAPYGPLDPAVRARLQLILTPEIDQLEQMLGRDLSAWKRT